METEVLLYIADFINSLSAIRNDEMEVCESIMLVNAIKLKAGIHPIVVVKHNTEVETVPLLLDSPLHYSCVCVHAGVNKIHYFISINHKFF